jgi:hypothetical protein
LADDRVKQVKEANDIVSVIEGYLELRPAGGARFKALCPFHDDHNPSLVVDQQWHARLTESRIAEAVGLLTRAVAAARPGARGDLRRA